MDRFHPLPIPIPYGKEYTQYCLRKLIEEDCEILEKVKEILGMKSCYVCNCIDLLTSCQGVNLKSYIQALLIGHTTVQSWLRYACGVPECEVQGQNSPKLIEYRKAWVDHMIKCIQEDIKLRQSESASK